MAAETVDTETKFLVSERGHLVGTVSYRPGAPGWFFIPYTTAHSPSRRPHETAAKAIPTWARKPTNRLISREEWDAR
jgi:hypothetical protein